MKISQFNSRSERERERESSLRTSSSLKFKKSFTLIELSIVLLILSLLVGSLLVGRQIVDRAKIQKILFELDYYEKNFHMFYDTYRTVVGHLTKSTCNKYNKFNALGCNFCNYIPDTVKTSKLLETDVNFPVYTLYTSEYLIEFGNIKKTEYTGCGGTSSIDEKTNAMTCTCRSCCFRDSVRQFPTRKMTETAPGLRYGNLVASFDQQTDVRFSGFNFKKQMNTMGQYVTNMFNQSNKITNKTLPHEFDNANFRSYLDMHNTVYFDKSRDIAATAGGEKNLSSFSAKMASELDAKVDDGRPGSGKILALKGGAAHNAGTTEAQHKSVCYDQMANDVDKGIYESSTNLKYGCNIIKVMEDVK